MKFRIVEQRGVFRIQKKEFIGWSLLLDLEATRLYPMDKLPRFEVSTYKKSENYIKKFYGSTGVDAIEKPEWRTA